jgi:hypothetical protein
MSEIDLLNNYGHCRLEHCLCIDQNNPRYHGAWGGLVCPDWVTLGARNTDDLIAYAKTNYKVKANEHKN